MSSDKMAGDTTRHRVRQTPYFGTMLQRTQDQTLTDESKPSQNHETVIHKKLTKKTVTKKTKHKNEELLTKQHCNMTK